MAVVITPADRQSFKRCRRAWDLGSRLRQGWEPDTDAVEADLGEAVRAALAVWYFPGMWEWDRAIVRPLAVEAYHRVVAGWTEADEGLAAHGERLLARYFDWAPSVDRFTPVRVETDFEVSIPDPADPVRDLATADGSAVHFAGRIELLVIDAFNAYWLVDHIVGDGWADVDALVLDESGSAFTWAWERFFLGMEIAGVIYNELRTDADLTTEEIVTPPAGPDSVAPVGHRRMYVRSDRAGLPEVTREGDDRFRRTRVSRGPLEMERVRNNLGLEARDMTGAGVAVYPSPSWELCSTCRFRPPCIALNTGVDADAVLAGAYRHRPAVEEQEGRLGGVTWSIGRGAAPPKFGRGPRSGR
jgi:hypothetical protein